jgi:hypothetical protein
MMGNIEAKIKKTFKKPVTRQTTTPSNGELPPSQMSSFSMSKKSMNENNKGPSITNRMLNLSMVSSASRGSKRDSKTHISSKAL